MKIIYFAHSVLSRGGDKMVLAHLAHLAESGHAVEIKTNVINSIFDVHPAITVHKLRFGSKIGTILSAITEKQQADCVIASIIAMTCFLSFRNGRKVLHFSQDYDGSYYSSALLKWLVRCFYHFSLKFFRIPVIAVSDKLAALLRERFQADVMVVENGVDTDVFYPDPDPELIGLKGDRRAILVLSRSDWRKGFDIARKAMESLTRTNTNTFEIWSVGEKCDGIFADTIHRDFGYVNDKRLRRIMSSADLFLYPTRHEGFGLMPIEAFACKCPVVTTEAVPFALHIENALVAKIEDIQAIRSHTVNLLLDRELAGRLVERAYSSVIARSLKRSSEQFEEALTVLSRQNDPA